MFVALVLHRLSEAMVSLHHLRGRSRIHIDQTEGKCIHASRYPLLSTPPCSCGSGSRVCLAREKVSGVHLPGRRRPGARDRRSCDLQACPCFEKFPEGKGDIGGHLTPSELSTAPSRRRRSGRVDMSAPHHRWRSSTPRRECKNGTPGRSSELAREPVLLRHRIVTPVYIGLPCCRWSSRSRHRNLPAERRNQEGQTVVNNGQCAAGQSAAGQFWRRPGYALAPKPSAKTEFPRADRHRAYLCKPDPGPRAAETLRTVRLGKSWPVYTRHRASTPATRTARNSDTADSWWGLERQPCGQGKQQ